MSTKHESELLERKVRSLVIEDDGTDTLVFNKGHERTVAKLLLLGQWADLYSKIINKNFQSHNYRFVDLLAGAGKTRIEEVKGKLIKGSVFAVDTFAEMYPFSKYVLVENNREKNEALKIRTSVFGEKCEILKKDCNLVAEEIFANYPYHNLVFIDNEGFDAEWKTLETVMKAKADIIINYPTAMFRRVPSVSEEKLNRFFGDESWRIAKYARKQSLEIYMEKLKKAYEKIKYETTGRHMPAYVNNIRLGNDTYFYDIILVSKQGPYTHYWEDLRDEFHKKSCDKLLDFINNKTSKLECFAGFNQKIQKLGDKPKKTKEPQKDHDTTLETYFPSQHHSQ
ncbi:MAG: three-Cys-motif partner protein TcmP [Candidatus Bathyarchaeia archaeon]|jgi:three-Cys-motif partner protein